MLLCEALAAAGASVTLFVTLRPDPSTAERLERKGVKLRSPILSLGWQRAIPQRTLVFQMWLAALAHQPRFIHMIGLSREAREILRLPHVAPVYVWETTEAQTSNKFVDQRIHRFLDRAQAVLAPSATVEQNLRSSYGYKGKVLRLPFWAEEPAESSSNRASHVRTNTILYFGRLDSDKGFEYLLSAFQSMRARQPDARLVICGGGDPSSIPGLVPAPDGVTLLGRVSEMKLDELIRQADTVVLASLHEGYPISLLEACARGAPIVATSVGSIPEVFSNRKCAILVPPRDSAALARALETMLDDSDADHMTRRADSRLLFEEVSAPAVVRSMLAQAYA